MSLFKHYRHLYKEPQRFTPAEARLNRLTAMLERERRFLEVPNFPELLNNLSGANSKKVFANTRRVVNDQKVSGHKAALIAAALSRS